MDPSTLQPYLGWRSFVSYERYAMDLLVELGWTPYTAAAIVGNLVQESAMNPGAINKGDAGPGMDSLGIGQWNRVRLATMMEYVSSRNGNQSYFTLSDQEKFDGQLRFVDWELRPAGPYMTARSMLLGASARDLLTGGLAGKFGRLYEGFGDSSEHRRDAYAIAAYMDYNLRHVSEPRRSPPSGPPDGGATSVAAEDDPSPVASGGPPSGQSE